MSWINLFREEHNYCTRVGLKENLPDKKRFYCNICGILFRSKENLEIHQRIKGNPCLCELCGLEFHNTFRYEKHQKLHLHWWPFACRTCNKSFLTIKSANFHEARCHGNKPWGCNQCYKDFFRLEDLEKHLDTHEEESDPITKRIQMEFQRKSKVRSSKKKSLYIVVDTSL